MKKILTATIVLAVAVLSGCNRNERYGKTEGTAELSLSISSEGEFTPLPATKAETSEDDVKVDVNDFRLVIKSSEGSEVESWSRFADVPAVIGLDPGSYTIEASSPGQKAVDWTQPKYFGSQSVTVTPGEVENVAIVCKLSNMKVTVRTTEKFDSEIEDFTVTVSEQAPLPEIPDAPVLPDDVADAVDDVACQAVVLGAFHEAGRGEAARRHHLAHQAAHLADGLPLAVVARRVAIDVEGALGGLGVGQQAVQQAAGVAGAVVDEEQDGC